MFVFGILTFGRIRRPSQNGWRPSHIQTKNTSHRDAHPLSYMHVCAFNCNLFFTRAASWLIWEAFVLHSTYSITLWPLPWRPPRQSAARTHLPRIGPKRNRSECLRKSRRSPWSTGGTERLQLGLEQSYWNFLLERSAITEWYGTLFITQHLL